MKFSYHERRALARLENLAIDCRVNRPVIVRHIASIRRRFPRVADRYLNAAIKRGQALQVASLFGRR